MSSSTILVTGANRGIGLEACRQLAEAGERVILTARSAEKGAAAAAELGVEFLRLDVADHASFAAFADRLKERGERLDGLVNNAGAVLGGGWGESLLEIKPEDLEDSIRINALGPFYLTLALRPLLNRGSSVVMVSSGSGSFCSGFQHEAPSYATSKTVLNVFTRRLARALAGDGVAVNAVCPGWVRTEMGGENAERDVAKGAETIVWLARGGAAEGGGIYRDKARIDW